MLQAQTSTVVDPSPRAMKRRRRYHATLLTAGALAIAGGVNHFTATGHRQHHLPAAPLTTTTSRSLSLPPTPFAFVVISPTTTPSATSWRRAQDKACSQHPKRSTFAHGSARPGHTPDHPSSVQRRHRLHWAPTPGKPRARKTGGVLSAGRVGASGLRAEDEGREGGPKVEIGVTQGPEERWVRRLDIAVSEVKSSRSKGAVLSVRYRYVVVEWRTYEGCASRCCWTVDHVSSRGQRFVPRRFAPGGGGALMSYMSLLLYH